MRPFIFATCIRTDSETQNPHSIVPTLKFHKQTNKTQLSGCQDVLPLKNLGDAETTQHEMTTRKTQR